MSLSRALAFFVICFSFYFVLGFAFHRACVSAFQRFLARRRRGNLNLRSPLYFPFIPPQQSQIRVRPRPPDIKLKPTLKTRFLKKECRELEQVQCSVLASTIPFKLLYRFFCVPVFSVVTKLERLCHSSVQFVAVFKAPQHGFLFVSLHVHFHLRICARFYFFGSVSAESSAKSFADWRYT